MPKAKASNKKRGSYDKPLKVNGSFMDIVKASVKHAEKKTPKKKG